MNVCFGQQITMNESGNYESERIVEVEGRSQDFLFRKALEWVALTYNSAQDVIQYSDKESGKIICKGTYSTNLFMKSGWIGHTLTLEFKEGKYRETYSNLYYYSPGSGEMPFESKYMGSKKKILEKTTGFISASSESLKKYLTTSNNDDW